MPDKNASLNEALPGDPDAIWLSPACDDPSAEGRTWRTSDQGDCEEPGCGCKSVKYVRADLAEWQPIETAPKDGTGFIGWHPDWAFPFAVQWSERHEKWCFRPVEAHGCSPTHWTPFLPLPTPPTKEPSQ